MPKVIVHLEGDSFEELRIEACDVLDLRIVSATQAELKVAELVAEQPKVDQPTAPTKPEQTDVKGTDEGNLTATVHTDEPKPVEVQEKKPRKRRTKAEMQAAMGEPEQPAASDTAAAVVIADAGKPLDRDSVRAAFDQYVKHYGVMAAQIDGPIMLGRVFGNSLQRIKDVPEDDQAKLGRIIAMVEGAILTNEFKRPAVQ
jgi:hypothetical protein